jgi:hypothetical protein
MHTLRRIVLLTRVSTALAAMSLVACGSDGGPGSGADPGVARDASAPVLDASGDSAMDGGLSSGDANDTGADAGSNGNDADAASTDGGLPCPEPAGTDKVIASFHPYPSTNTEVVPGFHVLSESGNVFFGVASAETDYSYFTVPRCGGKMTTLKASAKPASKDHYDRGDFAVDAHNFYYGDITADGKSHVMKIPVLAWISRTRGARTMIGGSLG